MPETPIAAPDEFANLVALIYKGVTGEDHWIGLLQALRAAASCDKAAIVLRPSRAGLAPIIYWDPAPVLESGEARRIAREHAKVGDGDPLRNALSRSGEALTLDDVISREELTASTIYQKVFQPYKIEYAVGVNVREPGGWECNLGLINGPDSRPFGAREKALLESLRPHMETALTLFSRLQCAKAERSILSETLDKLRIGIFTLDTRGQIIGKNVVAQHLLDRHEGVTVVERRLTLSNSRANTKFQALISAAIEAGRQRGVKPLVEALRFERGEIESLGLLVRSVDAGPVRSDVTPAAIVYVTGIEEDEPLDRLVSQMFGLTRSEAQLATLLAQGRSLAEAARVLGLSEHTVRSYAKSIFSKTGVGRQAELVRLILKSAAVLG